MKTLLLISLLSVTSAHAADMQNCMNKVINKCGVLEALSAVVNADAEECRLVRGGEREDGSRFSERVVLKDSNSLYSIDTGSCTVNKTDIFGSFKVSKEFKGRLFNITQDGRVIVIGRDNRLTYLLNTSGTPYVSVDMIMISRDRSEIVITLENKQIVRLDENQVTARLNL